MKAQAAATPREGAEWGDRGVLAYDIYVELAWVACRYVRVMSFVLLLFVTVCIESQPEPRSVFWVKLVYVGCYIFCWDCRATWSSVWDLIPAHRAIRLFGTGWPHDSHMGSSIDVADRQHVKQWHTRHKFLQIHVNSCTCFATNHLHTTSRRWPISPRFWPVDVKSVEFFVSSTRGLKTSEETLRYRWNQQIDFCFPSAMVHERSMVYCDAYWLPA